VVREAPPGDRFRANERQWGSQAMAKSYDVVLLGFRPDAPERPEAALARIVGITEEEGEALTRNAPRPVMSAVDYGRAEAFAASLGVAGAQVTIVDHPFRVSFADNANQGVDAAPLSLRSTSPAPEPSPSSEPALAAEPSTALALIVSEAPDGALPFRSTDVDVVSDPGAAPGYRAEPHATDPADHDEEPAGRMGVLSIPPPRPQRFRYAGVAVLIAAVYCIWVYLLERL
jgi:hypothetical protein